MLHRRHDIVAVSWSLMCFDKHLGVALPVPWVHPNPGFLEGCRSDDAFFCDSLRSNITTLSFRHFNKSTWKHSMVISAIDISEASLAKTVCFPCWLRTCTYVGCSSMRHCILWFSLCRSIDSLFLFCVSTAFLLAQWKHDRHGRFQFVIPALWYLLDDWHRTVRLVFQSPTFKVCVFDLRGFTGCNN